jgi:hypothetical protein
LRSTGIAEQDFLTALIEAVTGGTPTTSGKAPQTDLKFSVVVANTGTKVVSVGATPKSVIVNANPKSTRN